MQTERFQRAIASIDAENAADPVRLVFGGETFAKELLHAGMLSRWVERLSPDPSEALLLAARAHHLRRWERPRSAYGEGRREYLRWRTALYAFHSEQAARILAACGYSPAAIDRVSALIAKRVHRTDPEAQALEDGLCLVFLETQLDELAGRLDRAKMLDILRKTWHKMGPAGRAAALELTFTPEEHALVVEALGALPGTDG